jgi:hypothetical protein
MPGRGTMVPGLRWNSITNRFEFTGKNNTFLGAYEPAGKHIIKTISFVGSSAAISNVGGSVGANSVGTITNSQTLAAGDIVMCSPKFIATLGEAYGFRVAAADTLNFSVRGSLPAGGWDVLAFRVES